MAISKKNQICEWDMCMEKATTTEIYKGQLYCVCATHKKLINRQKKADNNI